MIQASAFGGDLNTQTGRSFGNGCNSLSIPTGIKDGRWYRKNIQDTQEIFTGGAYGERIKLDTLAKYFGVGAKNGDGAFFSELYFDNKAAAIDYLYNDLDITQAVWERMQ